MPSPVSLWPVCLAKGSPYVLHVLPSHFSITLLDDVQTIIVSRD